MAEQLVEIVGAVLILAAYVSAQFAGLSRRSYPYLLLNLAGAAVLAVLAALDNQWGFLLLQGVWALVALWGIVGQPRDRGAS